MDCDHVSTVKDKDAANTQESVAVLTGCSGLYAVLARGFVQPDVSVAEFFRECGKIEASPDDGISRCLNELLKSARAASIDELQTQYMNLFDPVSGPFPYEVEHMKGHEFAKAHVLADIMGFYRAFGVEPGGDRADHISAELEFMHLLAHKESHALSVGQTENAALCRDARQKFFREHLMTWTDELLEAMRRQAGDRRMPFYEHLMSLLELVIDGEKEGLT